LNFRANIAALKLAGATSILSLSAVGSLRDELHPGDLVVVDQFIDRTRQRVGTYFGTGCVAHVSMAEPVCRRLGDLAHQCLGELGARVHRGGTYVVMEGPQFSTRAESHWYRSMGASVIGMTNQPEAKLAREAELCYATVAMVTDYDCWHADHDAVTVEQVVAVLQRNAETAKAFVAAAARSGAVVESCPAGCTNALDHAVMTAPDARDPELVQRLSGPRGVAGRVL
jgi:5'-methylthioadenosine phosphorylase